jgi:hypothetical protein
VNAAPARRAQDARREHRLRVVPAPKFRAPRAPFVVVIVAILTVGLVGLLLLNTALAQGSFRMHDLQRQTAALQDREQQLQIDVDGANNPSRLAAAAHHLGLVAAKDPGFLRLADGRILGAPQAASAAPKKKPLTPQASVTPAVQPSGSAHPATQPAAKASRKPSAHPTASTAPRSSAHPAPRPTPTPAHGGHG